LRQNDQVITRLRSAIADLKCSTAAHAECEASPVAPSLVTTADVPTPSPEPEIAKTESPETIFAAQLLLGELRNAGEALLREVSALETRLNEEAYLVRATREYTAASKKAEGAAMVEQQAKELAQSASTQYNAAAMERRSADEHAKECAAAEDAARREAAEAGARVVACEAASAAAVNEAHNARERAEALKQALPQSAPSFAGISNVQTIATRIVEEAGALTRDARATERDPLEDTAQLRW
jgi:hypothetical protein